MVDLYTIVAIIDNPKSQADVDILNDMEDAKLMKDL